ncbi:DUF4258 domain-containing protein [Mesorhizobium sp. A556]
MVALKPIRYTAHASTVMQERELEKAWVEETARAPSWVEADPIQDGVERRFRAVSARQGRILRVAVVETPEEMRIISAFLDRRARSK